MQILLSSLHVLIAAFLVIAILLQSSRGGGLAGTFGGGSMGTMFGVRGTATFLTKATIVLAIAFMLSCILYTSFSPTTSPERRSALQRELERRSKETAPASALPLPRAPVEAPEEGNR
ncbi:MAG TPA: preprotein translocase subunit SecG [Candidatus Latescibacteria bacterium]|nr:preprotein translocase subunit SecG [Candidatus Latescibacterota bacterium]